MKINHCIVVILLLLSLLMWSGCKDNNNIEDIDFSCSIITNDCDNFNANIYLRDLSWENLNESDIKFIVEIKKTATKHSMLLTELTLKRMR